MSAPSDLVLIWLAVHLSRAFFGRVVTVTVVRVPATSAATNHAERYTGRAVNRVNWNSRRNSLAAISAAIRVIGSTESE